MIIPCEDCLLIPICRNKHFNALINDCSKVHNFMKVSIKDSTNTNNQTARVYGVEKIISPNGWRLTEGGMLEDTM